MNDDKRKQVMQLALAHRDRIWGYLMGLTKDAHRAEDLFQNTYLVICEKWSEFELGTNFPAWALTVARYEFLGSLSEDNRAAAAVEAEILENALAAADTESEPEHLALRKEALKGCLKQIKGRARAVLDLRYNENLNGQTIARRLNISLNALYSLLSRSRDILRDCITDRLQKGSV